MPSLLLDRFSSRKKPGRILLALLAIALLSLSRTLAQDAVGVEPGYRPVAEALARLVEHERKTKGIPAISIALVAEGRIVWSQGFGLADPEKGTPATADTVFRVGSVSKLFTDLALMQLVEKGLADLDAPVSRYLPTFKPENPTDKPITLRQLMSHRSGLTREPRVGHYFDPSCPSLSATVASLNGSKLVYPPEARTKYSNAAIAVVGQVVATLRNQDFESLVKATVLEPMGLTRSDFKLTPELVPSLARAQMWTYDGRTLDAPTFGLGTSSAGNLYSTANDMGRFLAVLLNDARGQGGPIVTADTFRSMRQVQFSPPETSSGFGLGFAVSNFEGTQRIGHGGAVYGFATEVGALPYAGLGVAVMASKDCENAVVKRISDDALRLLLATRLGKPLPDLTLTEVVDRDLGRAAERLGEGLVFRRGSLWKRPNTRTGGTWDELRSSRERLYFDGAFRVDFANRHEPERKEAHTTDRSMPPAPCPKEFEGLIGEYGWDHNVLYVYERDGKLWTLIEWFFDYPIQHVEGDRFRFGDSGLYDGEQVVFTRDQGGRAIEVSVGDVVFRRRAIGGEDGKTFRITPIRPVDEVRVEAQAATPPVEARSFRRSDLVDLTTLDATIKLDIRYASGNNFLGQPLYTSARAFLQKPAAEALARAHKTLSVEGLGLLIHDAYRPWYVTKMFWEATPPASRGFVANPEKGSRHNRGCAVDLTLFDLKTGEPISMVGGYDEFSDRSNPDYPGGTARQRWYRDRLRRAMEDEGFEVFDIEWWHFDFQDWTKYPILNSAFEKLEK